MFCLTGVCMTGTEMIFSAMTKAGITAITKEMISRTIKAWNGDYLAAKKAIRYLDGSEGFINYLVKHVSSVTRMRTIHSNESDIFLNDIYYPLTICDMGANFDFESNFSGVSGGLAIDDSFIQFDDKFTNIIGVAGQGKSTILRKIFSQHLQYMDKLPIFVELRSAEAYGIIEYLVKVFKNIGVDANKNIVDEILKSNRVSLFLDGFDEVSTGKRSVILDEIIDINLRYDIKIITSSRPETEICHTSNIKNLKVKKLNKKDIIGIIKKLNSNKLSSLGNEESKIIEKIESDEKLSQVMVSPILVTLLFVCYPYMDIIPNNHVEFYHDLFNTLYLRHDKLKGYTREKKSKLGNTQAYDCFCAFSFISLQKKQISMKLRDMVENAEIALRNIRLEKPTEHSPEALCDDFIDVTCLIQKDGYQQYSFLHKSICEYHAAYFIKQMGMHTKPIFYKKIIDDIFKNNSELLNTINFLKCLDKQDFAKNFTIPLLDKIGVNQWESPSDEIINELINDTLVNSSATLVEKDNTFTISGIRFNMRNIWLSIYEEDLESRDRNDISRVIFGELWKAKLNGATWNLDPGKKEIETIKLIDEESRENIKKELKTIMLSIHNDIYRKTKNIIETTEENMLSLLDIS